MANRLRLILIVLGALAVVAVYTFPLWQPVLLREAEAETVPGLPDDLLPAFGALPPDQQAFYRDMAAQNPDMAAQMLRAAVSPDRQVPQAEQAMPEMSNEVIIAEGAFQAADSIRQASGSVTIYQLPDSRRLLRLEDLRVTNGPDLRIVLARAAQPKTAAEVGTDYIDLGSLQGNVGSQNYPVPAELDLEAYQSAVIFSAQYGAVFGLAPLLFR